MPKPTKKKEVPSMQSAHLFELDPQKNISIRKKKATYMKYKRHQRVEMMKKTKKTWRSYSCFARPHTPTATQTR